MLHNLKSIFRSKKIPFTGTKHIIVPAFNCGNVQYYQFDSLNNLPWKRGLKFLSVYSELDSKCDRRYLEEHCKAMDKLLTGGKVGLQELSQILILNNQIKERLKMIYQEDLIYKVCSIVFFDETENPDDWEWKYALKKIEHWKKHDEATNFFLHEPIQKLIPFLSGLGNNIRDYSEVQKALDELQLGNIYEILFSGQKKTLPNSTERYFWEATSQNSN